MVRRRILVVALALAAIPVVSGSAVPIQSGETAWSNILEPGSKVKRVDTGYTFLEGPVWMRDGNLIFSDIPDNSMFIWDTKSESEIFRKPSFHANGNTLDLAGNLVTCEHGNRRISRTKGYLDYSIVTTAYQGKKFNSPNDAVVRSNGDIYFTDPPYGVKPSEEELGYYGVFRVNGVGDVTLLYKDMDRPNGIAFSPDEKRLYVSDSEKNHVLVFEVLRDGKLGQPQTFAKLEGNRPGGADGLRVDSVGNLYATGPGGVHVYNRQGRFLGLIEVPEVAANLCWGGDDARTLYITATKSLYSIRTKIRGWRY